MPVAATTAIAVLILIAVAGILGRVACGGSTCPAKTSYSTGYAAVKYSFVAKPAPDYLHALVTGNNSVDNVRRYLAELTRALVDPGCTRVLIEENLDGPSLGATDVYAVVTAAAREVPSHVQKIAYDDVNPEHDMGILTFAETVAVNRGVNVRRFATVAEATRWLCDDTAGNPGGPAR